MPPDYSIIIPAYNEEACLGATLASVRAAMAGVADLAGEVIVTDNASTDRTAEIARERGARVVHEPHRQISRSRNAGAAQARGRYFIFVDADTLISPELLRHALAELGSGRVVGGGAFVRFDRRLDFRTRLTLWVWTAFSVVCKWAAGSFVYCRREAFEAVGGFNERYYASEEIHISKALKRWGRGRRMRFRILREPVVTSLRKLDWYSMGELCRYFFRVSRNMSLLESRAGAKYWYERPGNGKAEG